MLNEKVLWDILSAVLSDCKPILCVILIGPPNEPGSLQRECALVWVPGQEVRPGWGNAYKRPSFTSRKVVCAESSALLCCVSWAAHHQGAQWAPVWGHLLFHFFLATLTLSQRIYFFRLQPLWATKETYPFPLSVFCLWFVQTGVDLLALSLYLWSFKGTKPNTPAVIACYLDLCWDTIKLVSCTL